MLKLKHIALSAFEIINDSSTILIDPFVSLNSQYNYRNSKNISDIFVTHGHYDHVGQTVEIAKSTGADVTAIVDVAAYFKDQGVKKVHHVGIGSWLNYGWGRCVFLPAIHTCTLPNGAPGGVAASILFEIDGVRIFHAGDTSLTVEFKGINEVYHPDVALLPIGGIYGMDIEHAAIAAEWLGAKTVVPMHYYLPPVIDVDPKDFAKKFEGTDIKCVILDGGNDELLLK